ncbi:hypothetical protein B0H13DRAFT_1481098, partial [Mycena leptocephala]
PQPAWCGGAAFKWEFGSLCTTYPFATASPNIPDYTLLSVDFVSSVLRVRSSVGFGTAIPNGCCAACANLGSSIAAVAERTQQDFGKKSTSKLNHTQMDAKIKALGRQLKTKQLKKLNHTKVRKRARKRLEEYKKLIDLLSDNNVPGLSRLLTNAKKESWSPSKTLEKAALALEGKYHPRNYTDFDVDLAILISEL